MSYLVIIVIINIGCGLIFISYGLKTSGWLFIQLAVVWAIIAGTTTAHASVTSNQVYAVFHRLQLTSHTHYSLKIVDNSGSFVFSPNAWSNANQVFINTDELKDLQNIDELAHVLGHELGHIVHGDYNKLFTHTYSNEYHADVYGAWLMSKAGYNMCRGIKWFKRSIAKYGDSSSITDAHPRDGLRYSNLVGGCKNVQH